MIFCLGCVLILLHVGCLPPPFVLTRVASVQGTGVKESGVAPTVQSLQVSARPALSFQARGSRGSSRFLCAPASVRSPMQVQVILGRTAPVENTLRFELLHACFEVPRLGPG